MELVFISPIYRDYNNAYAFNFFFSNKPEIVWGPDWDYNNPSVITDIEPDESTYDKIYTVSTPLPLKTIGETSCYSMEYAINRMVALAWVDIENLEEYPEAEGRCVLHFGDKIDDVKKKLDRLGATYDFS